MLEQPKTFPLTVTYLFDSEESRDSAYKQILAQDRTTFLPIDRIEMVSKAGAINPRPFQKGISDNEFIKRLKEQETIKLVSGRQPDGHSC